MQQQLPSIVGTFVGAREIQVPTWVKRTSPLMGQDDYRVDRSKYDFGTKVQRDKMAQPATKWCKLGRRDMWCQQQVMHGLSEAMSFLKDLEQSYKHYHGAGGVTNDMHDLWTNFEGHV